MEIYRINAMILRHLLLTFRVFQRFTDIMYWPLLNIILWGCNSLWHQQNESPLITFMLLTALLFWQILFRANMEVCYSLLDELRSNNFCNVFSTPLTLYEWMTAVVFIGLLKSIFTLFFGVFCIWFLYSLNILSIGWELVPFLALIILVGWSIGFLTASCIVMCGQNVEGLMWVGVWAFVPLSGIFFPLSVLPQWLQSLAYCLPQPYLFEGIRAFIMTGLMPTSLLIKGFLLSILYFVLSLYFFKRCFEQSKDLGLARLERYE
jgi:ABC-2 type transport system permease protein